MREPIPQLVVEAAAAVMYHVAPLINGEVESKVFAPFDIYLDITVTIHHKDDFVIGTITNDGDQLIFWPGEGGTQ